MELFCHHVLPPCWRCPILRLALSYPEPDVTNRSGVTVFMKVAHLAEAHNSAGDVAHDITVHLLAACPNRSYLETHGFGLDRYSADPMTPVAGCATAFDRPGHGIRFDWKRLDRARC
jgi:L-alanine-DL-glutamate epimerase-like enolase superfamily enzyme